MSDLIANLNDLHDVTARKEEAVRAFDFALADALRARELELKAVMATPPGFMPELAATPAPDATPEPDDTSIPAAALAKVAVESLARYTALREAAQEAIKVIKWADQIGGMGYDRHDNLRRVADALDAALRSP